MVKTGIEQWDAKVEIAQTMKALELPLTILRPVAFMELMVDPSYFPNTSVWYIWPKLTGGDYKIAWISVQDVGAVAAKAFRNPDQYVGRELALVADIKSLEECRILYKEVMGKYPSRFPMPMFLFELFVGKDLPNMWRWLRRNPLEFDTSDTQEIHPEAMTVQTWLRSIKS